MTVERVAAWSDAVDEILGGDQALLLAYVTPARGVVLTPVTNFGLRDRDAGTVTLLTSIGMWKKLERMQREPRVALAFHTRRHGFSSRPEYVVMQGRASFSWRPDPGWLESIGDAWERFMGPRDTGPLWNRWLRVYLWERVGVKIEVDRVSVWPDLVGGGPRHDVGPAPEEVPPPQRPPAKGTSPRLNHGQAAAKLQRLPDVVLGWVAGDGYPTAVPVSVDGVAKDGVILRAPAGNVPPGGRRAGVTGHAFTRHVLGQDQRVYTGWMQAESDGARVVYAPHTEASYKLPASKTLYRLAAGFVTRRNLRRGRRAGVVPR